MSQFFICESVTLVMPFLLFLCLHPSPATSESIIANAGRIHRMSGVGEDRPIIVDRGEDDDDDGQCQGDHDHHDEELTRSSDDGGRREWFDKWDEAFAREILAEKRRKSSQQQGQKKWPNLFNKLSGRSDQQRRLPLMSPAPSINRHDTERKKGSKLLSSLFVKGSSSQSGGNGAIGGSRGVGEKGGAGLNENITGSSSRRKHVYTQKPKGKGDDDFEVVDDVDIADDLDFDDEFDRESSSSSSSPPTRRPRPLRRPTSRSRRPSAVTYEEDDFPASSSVMESHQKPRRSQRYQENHDPDVEVHPGPHEETFLADEVVEEGPYPARERDRDRRQDYGDRWSDGPRNGYSRGPPRYNDIPKEHRGDLPRESRGNWLGRRLRRPYDDWNDRRYGSRGPDNPKAPERLVDRLKKRLFGW